MGEKIKVLIVDDAARLHDSLAPHDGEGEVVGEFVFLSLDAGKGHAVVGGDEDERVLELAAFFEESEHALEMAVEMLDFEGVIEHVVANDFVVGPEGRNLVDIGSFPAAVWLGQFRCIRDAKASGDDSQADDHAGV